MKSEYESKEDLNIAPDKWVANDSTISLYRYIGRIWGALFGLFFILNIDLQCRFFKNSQGCGFDSIGQTVGFTLVAAGIMSLLAGMSAVVVAKVHPSMRRFTILMFALFFIFNFGWLGIFGWIQPYIENKFWNEDLGQRACVLLFVIYLVGLGFLTRKLKYQQRKP